MEPTNAHDAYHAAPLGLRIGQSGTLLEVADFAEASRIYADLRDRSGLGASKLPRARLYRGDVQVAEVSYNGKVWDQAERCVFDPFERGSVLS